MHHCTVLVKKVITTPHRETKSYKIDLLSSTMYLLYKLVYSACTLHIYSPCSVCMLGRREVVLQVLITIHLVKDIIGYLI